MHEHIELFGSVLRHLPHAMAWVAADQRLVVSNRLFAEPWQLPPELVERGTPS